MFIYLINKWIWGDASSKSEDSSSCSSRSSRSNSVDSYITTPDRLEDADTSREFSISIDDDKIDTGESRYGTPRSSFAARYCQRDLSSCSSSSLSCDNEIEPLSRHPCHSYPDMLPEIDEDFSHSLNHRSTSMNRTQADFYAFDFAEKHFTIDPYHFVGGENDFPNKVLQSPPLMASPVAVRRYEEEVIQFSMPRQETDQQGNVFQLEEESKREYVKGGLAPVEFGEQLKKSHHIVRKLGFGSFSTVWLTFNTSKKVFSAIKINQAKFPQYAEKELELMKIIETKRTQAEDERIVLLTDHFYYYSPFGRHLCIVSEPLGKSLYHLIVETGQIGFSMDSIRKIARHCLEGLKFLHTKCKIVHTDIKPENIVIQADLKELEYFARVAIRDNRTGHKTPFSTANVPKNVDTIMNQANSQLFEVKKARLAASAGSFSNILFDNVFESESEYDLFSKDELKKEQEAEDSNDDELDGDEDDDLDGDDKESNIDSFITDNKTNFKIIDLGSACQLPFDQLTGVKRQTSQYRSPEAVLEAAPIYAMDIWSLACVLYEAGTGDYLFNPRHGNSDFEEAKNYFDTFVNIRGPPPSDFKQLHADNHLVELLFDDKCRYRYNKKRRVSFADYIRDNVDIYDPDFVELMDRMLCYHYERRATASDLLKLKFLS